jgi:hypothetical protein
MRNILFTCAIFIASAFSLSASIVSDPFSGSVQGAAGSDVGWGFTMTSHPNYYLSVLGSTLIGQTNPTLGVYADFIGASGGPSNYVLGPGAPDWIEVFDGISHGLGAFSIDPGALLGDTDSGLIEVLYAAYSADPNTCGTCILGTETIDIPFQVTVGANGPAAVPEPSFMGLTGLLLGAAFLKLRHRRPQAD